MSTGVGDAYKVKIADEEVWFPVAPGERILTAARHAGVWLPYECGWGSCGTCKITVVQGEVEALLPDAPSISPRDARRGRVLACQSTPASDLTIKPAWVSDRPREELPTTDVGGTLVDVEVLGPGIRRFRFELRHNADFREGQHAILDLGGGLRRCYSMANLSGFRSLEFIAKRYEGGRGSERLFELPLGAHITLEVPYGDMWVRDSAGPVCLVAGGTGVAPILSMLRRLVATDDRRAVHVFLGANTYPELVCWEELARLTDNLKEGHLHGALVEPSKGWEGTSGVATDALGEHLDELNGASYYFAGPPVMTNAVFDLLRQQGVQVDRLHYDSFG